MLEHCFFYTTYTDDTFFLKDSRSTAHLGLKSDPTKCEEGIGVLKGV